MRCMRVCALYVAALGLATFAFLSSAICAAAEDEQPRLSKADKEFLLGLIGKPLVDPTGKKYCTVTIVSRSCWGNEGEVDVAGWYEPAADKTEARVYFVDGDWMAAPKEFRERDFLAESKTLVAPADQNKKEERSDGAFRRMRMTAAGSAADVPELVRAAWLAKLGEDVLAAQMLAKVRSDDMRRGDDKAESPDKQLIAELKENLAWRAFADGVHAYMQRADEDALRNMKRLNDLYPESINKFGDGPGLLADLKRRQEAKTFGKDAAKKPDDFGTWEQPKQISWLIGQLDEVDARQWGQPGGVHLAGDWRVAALIEIGDAAIETLITAVEKDRRLTRSVHFWRDFAQNRTVLSVREAALTAAMSIMKVRAFEPAATGDNFTSRGEKGAAETAARLRKYWQKFGKLSFEERMMKVLTDKESTPQALREAAANLARVGEYRTLGTTVFTDMRGSKPRNDGPRAALKKFESPTVAEAVVAAMDRDLAQHDKNEKADQLWDYHRIRIEGTYIGSLMALEDKRIAPELTRRAGAAETVRMRREFALAAHVLGEPAALEAFANDFKEGKIKLPANDEQNRNWDDQPGTVELRGIVRDLGSVDTPAADAALMALADPKHAGHAIAAQGIKGHSHSSDSEAWFAHRYCIKMLRAELDNTASTGSVATIDGDSYTEQRANGSSSGGIPEIIAKPDSRRERVELRRCDEAAEKLSQLVIGSPPYHPLLKDADARLAEMRKVLDAKMETARPAKEKDLKEHPEFRWPAFVIEK
jgi:hypothetical protein